MWNKFVAQDGRCALTGEKLTLPCSSTYKSNNASLDRVNSNKPYNIDNIQWVTKKINKMKHDLDEKEFITICNRVSEFTKENLCATKYCF